MKRVLFAAMLILMSATIANSNGVILAAAPTEEELHRFILKHAEGEHIESIRLANNDRPLQLFLVSDNLLFGYFNDGKIWKLFVYDVIEPGTLQIRVLKTNTLSYKSPKGNTVELDLANPKPREP